jgi:hypothetical protein
LARAVLEHFDRAAPSQLLRVVDLAEIQHLPLHHAPAGYTLVLDHAEVAVLLTVLLPNLLAQEHGQPGIAAPPPRREQGRSALRSLSTLSTRLAPCAPSTYHAAM